MENQQKVKPFGFRDKISYMIGNMGNDFMFLLATMYLLKFYTDVMGVSAALVGSMMMLARFVDAFTDVAMGQIVDRAPTKAKGKFTPFLRIVSGPVAIASFLMYAVWFKDMSMSFKIFWMFFTYLLWGSVFYTGINIPYGSMASAITDSPKERAELSNWRTIGNQFVLILVGVVLPSFLYYTNEAGQKIFSGTRMAIVAGIFSILSFTCFMICYHTTTERIKFASKEEKFSLITLFKGLVKNKALIGLVLVSLLVLLGQLSFSNMQAYIYPNYFGSTAALSAGNLIAIAVTFGCAPFVVKLSDRFGRKNLAIFSAVMQAAAYLILYFIHTDNVWVFLGMVGVVGGVGTSIISLITWAMITDVIDDTEVVTGERSDGTIYSVYSFARKCGQGFSSGLAGAMLSLIGYTTATAFEPEIVNGIYDVTCLVPAATFVVLIFVTIFLYPLGKKRVDANTAELRRRRENMN